MRDTNTGGSRKAAPRGKAIIDRMGGKGGMQRPEPEKRVDSSKTAPGKGSKPDHRDTVGAGWVGKAPGKDSNIDRAGGKNGMKRPAGEEKPKRSRSANDVKVSYGPPPGGSTGPKGQGPKLRGKGDGSTTRTPAPKPSKYPGKSSQGPGVERGSKRPVAPDEGLRAGGPRGGGVGPRGRGAGRPGYR